MSASPRTGAPRKIPGVSRLLHKARSLHLQLPLDLERLAINRGCDYYERDLGPQSRQYYVDSARTLVQITVAADGGTPNIILGRSRAGTIVNVTSAALATAASGGIACSNTGGTASIGGVTTCTNTLQNTSFNADDWVTLVSGTAGGTAKEMTACLTWTVN